MLIQLKIPVPQSSYIKDPQDSKLGFQIFHSGIEMMNDLGFENFTFKKLAAKVNCSEVSIYRYFESKHQFLQFLFAWYWGLMEYKIHFTNNQALNSLEKLNKAIDLIVAGKGSDLLEVQNEKVLEQIIKNEGFKAFMIKNVDEVNSLGVFENYKKLVDQLVSWLQDECPEYPYPRILISNLIEGSLVQKFYSEHLPRLTNILNGECQSSNYFLSIYNQVINEYGTSK